MIYGTPVNVGQKTTYMSSTQALAYRGIDKAVKILLAAYIKGEERPFTNKAVLDQALQETRLEGTFGNYAEEDVQRSLILVNSYFRMLDYQKVKIVLIKP